MSPCLLLLFLFANTTLAQPAQLKTPEGQFDVYEWVIFLCDPNQPQANSGSLYGSTLPDFIGSRRSQAPVEKEDEPTPVGVIRFSGSSGSDKVDVLLENKGGRFLAQWPKGQSRSNGVLWQNLVVTDKAPDSQEQLGANNWMGRLRDAKAPFLLKDNRGERFLLYDAEPNYKLPLKVAAGSAALQYAVTNGGKDALRDLTFYKKQPDGSWQTATVAELKPTNAPATKLTSKPSTTTAVAVRSTAPTTGAATTQATTQPAGATVALSPTDAKDEKQVLAPWKDRLTKAGLPDTDFNLIVDTLAKHALDGQRLTAVYRLDADQLEQLLPMEVTPQPRKTVRVGLVIVRNIDPAIAHEVDDLVAQLGDPSWEKREAAQASLEKIGISAKPKLDALLKNAKDPEVTYRIERLLGALTRDANPNGPPVPQ